jgi:hypothetical protein
MSEVKVATPTASAQTPSVTASDSPNYSWWLQPSKTLASARCTMELDGTRLYITQYLDDASPQQVLDALLEGSAGDLNKAQAAFRKWQSGASAAIYTNVPQPDESKSQFPDMAYYEADGSNLSFQRIKTLEHPSDVTDEFGSKIYELLKSHKVVQLNCSGEN